MAVVAGEGKHWDMLTAGRILMALTTAYPWGALDLTIWLSKVKN